MTDAGFFRGTSAEQDNRFSDKHKKLLKQLKFSDNLAQKVDTTKVKLDVLKPWITKQITNILGMEDEVVVEFVVNQLEADKHPDGKMMQINLTGFLNGKNAREFMGDLWGLLISGNNAPDGIPPELIEAKKEEIIQREELEKQQLEQTKVDPMNGASKVNAQLLIAAREEQERSRNRDSPPPRKRSRSRSPRPRDRSPEHRRKDRGRRRERSHSDSPPPRKRSRSPRQKDRSPEHRRREHGRRRERERSSSDRGSPPPRRHSRTPPSRDQSPEYRRKEKKKDRKRRREKRSRSRSPSDRHRRHRKN